MSAGSRRRARRAPPALVRAGLGLVALSGALMFTAHATEWAENPAFRLKLLLIVAAGLNAWAFHRGPSARARWDRDLPARPRARVAAGLSIALWLSVITCGRLLAYL